jgi:hypothetical protein
MTVQGCTISLKAEVLPELKLRALSRRRRLLLISKKLQNISSS